MEPEHAANYTEGAEVKLTLQMDPFGVYNIESVIIFSLLIGDVGTHLCFRLKFTLLKWCKW